MTEWYLQRVTKQSGFSLAPLQAARLSVINHLGKHPRAFNRLVSFGSGRSSLVGESTDLCVEAPPGSGNSFFVVGFLMTNPGATVAHHHHVPAQVLNAARLDVPVLTILRDPIQCALSRAVPGNRPFLITTTLKRWITFWSKLEPQLSIASPVTFEAVTSNPKSVIEAINSKYGSGFLTDFPDERAVFASIESARLLTVGSDSRPGPNTPDIRKAEKKAVLRPVAESHPLAGPALELYQSLLGSVKEIGLKS